MESMSDMNFNFKVNLDSDLERVSILVLAHFKKGTIRIGYPFCVRHKDKLSNYVTLRVEGYGDYRVKYDKESGSLINLEKFMKNMEIRMYSPVILTYVGKSCFLLKIFMPIGLELPYKVRSGTFLKEMNRISSGKKIYVNPENLNRQQKMIMDHRALAVRFCNLYYYKMKPIVMRIDSCHVAAESVSLELDEEYVTVLRNSRGHNLFCVLLGQLDFGIEIEFKKEGICFGKGWKEFVTGAGLEDGELLILQPDNKLDKIRACVVDDVDSESYKNDEDVVSMLRFLSIMNNHSLSAGVIGVPQVLSIQRGHSIMRENTCILQNGVTIPMTYDVDNSCFSGFEEFFERAGVECDDIMYLKNNAASSWSLFLFKSNFIGMLDSDNCPFDKLHMMLPKEYPLRSRLKKNTNAVTGNEGTTVNVVDEQNVENADTGAVENPDVQMMDVGDDMDEVNAAGDDVLDNLHFEVTLTKTNVDKNSHGVYVPPHITPNGRNWIAGDRVILLTARFSINAVLVISNGRPRFSTGWNAFIRSNEFKENDTLQMTMVMEEDHIVFHVDKIN